MEEGIKRLRKKVEDEKVLGMLAHIDKIVDENILDNIAIETVLQALKDKENKINKCIETINQLKTGEYIKGPKHYYSSLCCNARLDIIQELLEGK